MTSDQRKHTPGSDKRINTITIEIDEAKLRRVEDKTLASWRHVAQANSASLGDKEAVVVPRTTSGKRPSLQRARLSSIPFTPLLLVLE